jgi:hypothetical protein
MLECRNTDIIKDIYEWADYVGETKTSNDFAICPHALKVFKHRRLQVFWYDPKTVDQVVASFRRYNDRFKVWALICKGIDPIAQCEWLNKNYQDLVWLYDLANDPGYIDGTRSGNGKHDLILLQDRKELNELSAKLERAGYYSNWSRAYYEQVVAWRTNK